MEEEKKQKNISYSQFSLFKDCPYRWKLLYMDGLRKFNGTIHTLFGTAMHETIQNYLTVLYNESEANANAINLHTYLKERMIENFNKGKEDSEGTFDVSKEQLIEFYTDGVEILNWFLANRMTYFPTENFELTGIELPIDFQINGVKWIGFLDAVVKDTKRNRIKIIDFKTSTNGWSSYQTSNDTKLAQLLLYKKFYSQQFNFPIENIDVEFVVLKRKIKEQGESRFQSVIPRSDEKKIGTVLDSLNDFIHTAFTTEGEYNTTGKFKKNANYYTCKFCEFLNSELCDKNKQFYKLK